MSKETKSFEVEIGTKIYVVVSVEAANQEEATQKALEEVKREGTEDLGADCFVNAEVNSITAL